jgi:hypothetical protein
MLYFYCHNILRDENKKKGTVTGVGNNSLLDVQALGSLFRSLIYNGLGYDYVASGSVAKRHSGLLWFSNR